MRARTLAPIGACWHRLSSPSLLWISGPDLTRMAAPGGDYANTRSHASVDDPSTRTPYEVRHSRFSTACHNFLGQAYTPDTPGEREGNAYDSYVPERRVNPQAAHLSRCAV